MNQNQPNIYYALRHGRSEANEQDLIVSDPDRGIAGFGLSAAGRASLNDSLKQPFDDQLRRAAVQGRLVCYSSDFLRARQTAEIFCATQKIPGPIVCAELRERFFGELEGESSANYERVWQQDILSAQKTAFGAECTDAVRARLLALLARTEHEHRSSLIVFVSHGDTLQILQTIFEGRSSNEHRSLPHLETGELRRLGPHLGKDS